GEGFLPDDLAGEGVEGDDLGAEVIDETGGDEIVVGDDLVEGGLADPRLPGDLSGCEVDGDEAAGGGGDNDAVADGANVLDSFVAAFDDDAAGLSLEADDAGADDADHLLSVGADDDANLLVLGSADVN